MKILNKYGKEDLAIVYIGETQAGKRVEFVESLEPPYPRGEKWVIIVSSLYGCPVECEMCDAGGTFKGELSTSEILEQIDHLIKNRYPDGVVPVWKFKIQFARMGEPSFNNNVLDVLRLLPTRYNAPGLMPSLSTIAPFDRDDFFEQLLQIKNHYYPTRFQLQFSIHSTDEKIRNQIIPTKKWTLEKIARYGERFYSGEGRKITLNFVLAKEYFIDPSVLRSIFSPEIFFIKLTPLNPTYKASVNRLRSGLTARHLSGRSEPTIAKWLKDEGYDVLLSIGELEENLIGSNCGQYIMAFEECSNKEILRANSYNLEEHHLLRR